MKFPITPVVQAPHSTGHPWSLPEIRKPEPDSAPLNPAGTAAGHGHLRERDVPRPALWSRADEPAPPPSAIQIEIETMLAEQAENLDRMAQDSGNALLGRPSPVNRD